MKPLLGKYKIYSNGEIRNLSDITLKPYTSNGYKVLKLSDETGQRKSYLVHRLVYTHYVKEIPDNMWVIFKDGNKNNLDYTNLEAVPPSEALSQAKVDSKKSYLLPTREYNGKLSKEAIAHIRASSKSQHELAAIFSVSQATIHKIINNMDGYK